MKKDATGKKIEVLAIIVFMAGCAGEKYVQTRDKACVQATTKTEATAAAEKVLAGMLFEIEKLDTEAGYIRTRPLAGAQTLEFWRKDSVGAFNRAEADLHSIRRTAELDVNEQDGRVCINCIVTTERLSVASERTSGPGYRAAGGPRSVQKLGREIRGETSWIDLGRDEQLETEILKRIESRLSADKKQLAQTRKEK
jgi:hypothetical protein